MEFVDKETQTDFSKKNKQKKTNSEIIMRYDI